MVRRLCGGLSLLCVVNLYSYYVMCRAFAASFSPAGPTTPAPDFLTHEYSRMKWPALPRRGLIQVELKKK